MRSRLLISRLDRYIFRQLLFALVAVTGGLVALIWLTQSLRFVELIVNRGLSPVVFLKLTGLLIPSFIAVILPITTFVVVQFVYQRLAGDRELTVMRAAGLSPYALARPALVLTVMVVCMSYVLNLWVVPASLTAFREFQFAIRNRIAAFLLQEGVFTPISADLTVYIRSRDPNGTLHGILVNDERNKNAPATILAESGRILSGPSGPRVVLFNGSRQEIDRHTGRLDVLSFKQNTIDLAEAAHTTDARYRDDSEVSLRALLHPDPRWVSPQDVPKWHAEAHKRLAGPLTAASYALVALVSVLGGPFRRHGGLLRPAAAVTAMVLLLAAELAVDNLAAKNNVWIPLIWVQAVVPGLIAGWLLFRPQFTWSLRGLFDLAGPADAGRGGG